MGHNTNIIGGEAMGKHLVKSTSLKKIQALSLVSATLKINYAAWYTYFVSLQTKIVSPTLSLFFIREKKYWVEVRFDKLLKAKNPTEHAAVACR